MKLFYKGIICFVFLIVVGNSIYAEDDENKVLEPQTSDSQSISLSLKGNKTQLITLKTELQEEIDKIDKEIQKASFNHKLYKGLAISGYSLTGVGLGFIILDSLVATPKEDPISPKKFGGLTWGGIPIAITGAILSITFRVLEEKTKDKQIVLEGSFYDLRGELEVINNQLSNFTE